MPDERTRVMRRRLARRAQLVGARSRSKNEVHAVLMRRLISLPKVSDLFGQAGRRWLAKLELPLEERESLEGSMRQIEFLDQEISEVDRLIALDALTWPEITRLMSVPGVNVICAASFLAAIGSIERFKTARKLVGYLGLDPKIRQSGPRPSTSGHISKQGSASARWALVEASWSTVRQPGPMRAFYQRVRSRRGHQVAVVAAARKLACLFWCLLTRDQDYAYQQPSLTKKKLRRLEIAAGAPKYQGRSNIWSTNKAIREAERRLAEQAEHAYRNTVRDWHATQTNKAGASATPGHAPNKPSKGNAARQTTSPSRLRFATSVTRAHQHNPTTTQQPQHQLDSHPSRKAATLDADVRLVRFGRCQDG
jgi:hypothetical protein